MYVRNPRFFHNFVKSLDKSGKAYSGFIHLLGKCTTILEPWFTAVAARPDSFAANLNSVHPLWNALDDAVPVNKSVYVYQREQFMWSSFVDTILGRALPQEEDLQENYYRFFLYCERAAACYPQELGTALPISHRLFVPYFFEPAEELQPNWLA